MKDIGQALYEKFSSTFDIKEQIGKNGSLVHGPIPWRDLDPMHKLRWTVCAREVIDTQQANALEQAQSAPPATVPAPTFVPQGSETMVCGECGAHMMKGENHDCETIKKHRRALGHRLPGDP